MPFVSVIEKKGRERRQSYIYIPYYLANTPPFATTPPPPPIVLMKTTAQVLLSVKTLTVTNNLCNIYKILYYAVVYVRGHFCWHVIIRVSYLQSLYSIVVHGYVVHSVLASYNYNSVRSVYVKTGRGA